MASMIMITRLLSDPTYILPDNNSVPDTATLRRQIQNVYVSITRIRELVATTPEEDIPALIQQLQARFPGFNKNLIPISLDKLNVKLAELPLAGGRKSRRTKRKTKRCYRRG